MIGCMCTVIKCQYILTFPYFVLWIFCTGGKYIQYIVSITQCADTDVCRVWSSSVLKKFAFAFRKVMNLHVCIPSAAKHINPNSQLSCYLTYYVRLGEHETISNTTALYSYSASLNCICLVVWRFPLSVQQCRYKKLAQAATYLPLLGRA